MSGAAMLLLLIVGSCSQHDDPVGQAVGARQPRYGKSISTTESLRSSAMSGTAALVTVSSRQGDSGIYRKGR